MLLLYSIKSALVLTMLYVPYVLLLRRESFFRFNRMVLLGILLLSLLLPLCNASWMSLDRQPVVQAAQVQMLEMGIPVRVLPEVQVVAEARAADNLVAFSLFHLLTFIYISGMVLVLVVRLWQMGRLQRGLKRGVLWHNDEQGVRICCLSGDVAPFSWMRNIVISEKDYEEAGREIVLHEKGHIQGGHSWDVVLLTLVQMVQWWNPLCYMMGISLRDVHEFEADSYVLRQGVSAPAYQLLLIKKAVGSGAYAFANNFNHSLTKKRITMMKRNKSNPWMRARVLYVIPVVALALSAFATPKFSIQKDVKPTAANACPLIVLNDSIVEIPEEAKDTLTNRMHEEQLTELLNINIEDVESVAVLQKEAATAMWSDKGSNGAIVIRTRDGRQDEAAETGNDTIYNVVAVRAKYPGGDEECFKFISENVRYPKLCYEFGVQGRVIVRFVVEKDGSITHVEKVRGVGKTLSEVEVTSYKQEHPDSPEQLKAGQDLGDLLFEEAKRVLELMPKWEPGKDEDGNPVRSIFNLPVMFRLQ